MFAFAAAIHSVSSSPANTKIWSNDNMYEYAQTEVRTRGNWLNYIALLRLHYHTSFVGVLLGALIVTRHWPALLIWQILLLSVSLNLLLYGGLYSINAITDAEGD